MGLIFVCAIALTQSFPLFAHAQIEGPRRVNPLAISTEIYQQLPDFPLENQYLSSDTGAPNEESTLVSRIIRYHLYIKNRPATYRIDWKLTLADYLGVFESISADGYADYGLQDSPLDGDRAVIQNLSPAARDRLVNALYEAFTTPRSDPNS